MIQFKRGYMLEVGPELRGMGFSYSGIGVK